MYIPDKRASPIISNPGLRCCSSERGIGAGGGRRQGGGGGDTAT